jgi:hypothetical protein
VRDEDRAEDDAQHKERDARKTEIEEVRIHIVDSLM